MPDDPVDILARKYGRGGATEAAPDPVEALAAKYAEDAPLDFDTKREILRRVTRATVSPGGTDLFSEDVANPRYRHQIDVDFAKVIPGATTKAHGDALLLEIPTEDFTGKPPVRSGNDSPTFKPPPESSFGDVATTLAKRAAHRVTSPPAFLASTLLGQEGADQLASEHLYAPGSGAGLSPEREAVARAAIERSAIGRTANMAIDLGAAMPSFKTLGRGLKAVEAGPALASSGTMAIHGGLTGGGEGFGSGSIFGALAHGIEMPLSKWIDRLPAALKGTVVERLSNAGAGGTSFAAADAVMNGVDAERAIAQFGFGGLLGWTKAVARVEATPETPLPVVAAIGHARLTEAEYAKADALKAATAPDAEPTPGEPVEVTLARGQNRLSAQAAPEAPAAPREEVIQPTVEAPKPEVKVKAAERGGLDPDVVPEMVKGAKGVIEREVGSFIQRIRSSGGEAARDVADKAEKVVDSTKKNLGEMSAELDAALEASGGAPFTAKGKAASDLSRPVPVEGKDYFRSRLLEGIEGKVEAKTPEEQRIIEAQRGLIDKLGRMAVDRGVQQYDPRSGEMEQPSEPPAAPGESVAPGPVRNPSSPLLPETDRPGVGPLSGLPSTEAPRGSRGSGVAGRHLEDPILRPAEVGSAPGPDLPGVMAPRGPAPEVGRALSNPTTPLIPTGDALAFPAGKRGPAQGGTPREGGPVNPLLPEPVGREMPGVEPVVGRMTEAGNVDVPAPSGWAPFRYIPGGKVAPRIMAPEMIDLMVEGPKSPLWKKVINAFADINGLDPVAVERDFLSRNEEMSGIKGPEGQTKRIQAEFRRSYRNVPVAIRHNGQIIDLFESNPATYARRLAETRAARYGVIEHLGQDIPQPKPIGATGQSAVLGGGPAAPETQRESLSKLRERFAKETNRDEDFTALMRGLHGQQISRPIIPPGSVRAQVAHAANLALKGIKTLNLSASAVQNIPESMGSTMTFTGVPILAKRAWQMVTRSKEWKDARAFAEVQGAVTRDVLNMSYDPTRPFASTMRIFSEVGRRAFLHGPVNESQESLAAVGARDVANRLKAGRGTATDAQRLMGIGMEEGLARRLAEGKGTDAEYDAMVRKAPGQLVGANLSPVEMSKWESRRPVKALTAFHRYAWMTARGAANQAGAYLKTMRGVTTDSTLTPKERWSRAVAAHRVLGGYMAGKALQGSVAYLLTSLVTGGTTGLKIAWNEAQDDPVSFAWQSFVYSTVGGPFSAIARSVSGKDQIDNAIYPWFLTKELFGLATGANQRYKDKDFTERLGQFVSRTVPVTRMFETALAATGLGSPEAHAIETSKRAFFRWRYDRPRKGTFIPGDDTMGAEYRANIRRAYQAVIDHDTPDAVNEHVMKALGVKGKDKRDVAEAILRKRLLTPDSLGVSRAEAKATLDALKSRIGEDAFRNLETHDALLDRLATAIKGGK